MKKLFSRLAAGFVGLTLCGTLCSPSTAFAVKENEAVTTAKLQTSLDKSFKAATCKIHAVLTIVNGTDQFIVSADSKIEGLEKGSFAEGQLTARLSLGGKEVLATQPYYIVRVGDTFTSYTKNGDGWSDSEIPLLSQTFGQGLSLENIFGPDGDAKLVAAAEKSRTIIITADALPFIQFLQYIAPHLLNERVFAVDAAFGKRIKPVEMTVRIDNTTDRVSDVNAEMTNLVRNILERRKASANTTTEQQQLYRLFEKGIVNLHLSINDYDVPIEFTHLPEDFGVPVKE